MRGLAPIVVALALLATVPLVMFILVLLFRPSGLLGERT